MKNLMRIFFVVILMLHVCSALDAQTLETTTEYPTGYWESSYFNGSNTIKSIDGVLYMIYDDTPMVLLRYPASNPRTEFEVPSTVRRIANNAFQGTKFLKTLKLHNEVTFGRYVYLVIGESAFNDSSIENFVVIENNKGTSTRADTPEAVSNERKEIHRYDIKGMPTNASRQNEVQIIQYDDGSTKKVK